MRHVVVVVGGGIAGLAAAHALRGRATVTVVDGADRVGGKLHTSDVAGLPVDEGAEQFLVRAPEAVELVTEVGLAADLVHPRTSSASLWSRGRLRALPARTLLGVPSSIATLRGVLTAPELARASLDRVLPGRSPAADVAVGTYVRRRLGRAVVDRLVDPLLGGVYAGRADALSLRATMPQLPLVDGSLMAAVATMMPAAGEPARPVFASLTGGLQRLVDRVVAESGATVLTGRAVRAVERLPAGFRVVHGPTIDAQAIECDAVVVATPATPAARLLRPLVPTAAGELAGIDYASVAIVTLAFRRDEFPEVPGSGYLVPAVEGRAVKAVTFASGKWSHLGESDAVIVRCSVGRHGDVRDLQRDDNDLVRLALDELQQTIGIRGGGVAARVSRWGGGLPQYAVGHLDRVRRIRASVAQVPGLAVCGAAYDGVGIPACIRSGRQAATDVLPALPTDDGDEVGRRTDEDVAPHRRGRGEPRHVADLDPAEDPAGRQ